MSPHSDDRFLWILVGVGLVFAARSIPRNLQLVRELTQIRKPQELDNPETENAENEVQVETLSKLTKGHSDTIRSCASVIAAKQCTKGPARKLLLKDLTDCDEEKRYRAIDALYFLLNDMVLHNCHLMAHYNDLDTFHTVISTLVNLLHLHRDRLLPPPFSARRSNATKISDGNIGDFGATKINLLSGEPSTESPQEQISYSDPSGAGVVGNPTDTGSELLKTKFEEARKQASLGGGDDNRYVDLVKEMIRQPEVRGWQKTVLPERRAEYICDVLRRWDCNHIQDIKDVVRWEANVFHASGNEEIYDATRRELIFSLQNYVVSDPQPCAHSESGDPIFSPVYPPRRSCKETKLLRILYGMIFSQPEIGPALSAGLVFRWLSRYPFPCRVHDLQCDTRSKPHDVLQLLTENWSGDDPHMAKIVGHIASSGKGVRALHRYGLSHYLRVDSLHRPGEDRLHSSIDSLERDVVMTDGEDTAGLPPVVVDVNWGDRPGSSWSRRPPNEMRTEEDEAQRRRRREAVVISDGDAPLRRENILERQNSRAALAPISNPEIEAQLAQLSEEIDREDEETRRHSEREAHDNRVSTPSQSREWRPHGWGRLSVSDRPENQREPLADVTNREEIRNGGW